MFFGISENVKRRRIISMFLPPLFLRHCRYSDGIEADIFAKVRDLTKRHETKQSSPKPSKWWVGGQERGPKMAHLGFQIHKISSFKPCAVPGNILLLVTGMAPRPQKTSFKYFLGKGSQNWLPGELQTREKTIFMLCRIDFQKFAPCRMLKTRRKVNGPIP